MENEAYIDGSLGFQPFLEQCNLKFFRNSFDKELMKFNMAIKTQQAKVGNNLVVSVKINIMKVPRSLALLLVKSLQCYRIKTLLSTFRTETIRMIQEEESNFSMSLFDLLSRVNSFGSRRVKFSPSSGIFFVIISNFLRILLFPSFLRRIFVGHNYTSSKEYVRLFI